MQPTQRSSIQHALDIFDAIRIRVSKGVIKKNRQYADFALFGQELCQRQTDSICHLLARASTQYLEGKSPRLVVRSIDPHIRERSTLHTQKCLHFGTEDVLEVFGDLVLKGRGV